MTELNQQRGSTGAFVYRLNPDGTETEIELGVDDEGSVKNNLFVAKNGNDSNIGDSLEASLLTVEEALRKSTPGTTIFIRSGDYTIENPIEVPRNVAIVGDNLRTVTIRPANPTLDIFHVNNGCYITGVTFRGHVAPSAAVAFPEGGAGPIFTSPYVQNCSSITTTGTGMRVDGNRAEGLKSMVVDAFTQYNQGGVGIHMLNQGYTQLVSVFTICCDVGILCESGGFCSVTNSNSSFGNYGLKADGVSGPLYYGRIDGANQLGSVLKIKNLEIRPRVGDAIRIGESNVFLTIDVASPLIGDKSNITIEEFLQTAIPDNTLLTFHQRSLITSSSHTFEFIGTGTDILTATPGLGGIPIQENEIVELNGGEVYFTSTDQKGDFRIGKELTINREEGTITGETFDRSLFAVLTPYILALEG